MADVQFPAGFFDGSLRTVFYAGAAADAQGLVPEDLDVRILALRVGAPFAGERAAFEEYDRPDPGAVVEAEFLDVEDHARGGFLICHELGFLSCFRI